MVAHAPILIPMKLLIIFFSFFYDAGKLFSKFDEDRSINNVTFLSTDARQTDGRTDVYVILYSVQCYALRWTDNNQSQEG